MGSGGKRGARRDRITRGLTFLGLAAAVVGPFGLLVVGVENDEPGLALVGFVLGVIAVALVVRRRPQDL
jgi:hypothetical protein